MTPTPILLLGSPRSGTTWLGNLLACHPRIAGAHHEVHWGAVELPLYAMEQWAGDLSDDRTYIQFLETFAASDFFRLVGADKRRFYERRPADLYELVFELMDEFAQREGTAQWAVKLDPPYYYRDAARTELLGRMDARYPEIRLVGIRRAFPAVLRSYLNMESRESIHRFGPLKRLMAVVLETARYVVHNRSIERIIAQRGGRMLAYEDLRADPAATMEQLGEYLGVDLAGTINPYRPNSSFVRSGDATPARAVLWLANRVLRPLFELIPQIATSIVALRDRSRRPSAPYYWRLLRRELMAERLKADLERSGEVALHDALFPAKPDTEPDR